MKQTIWIPSEDDNFGPITDSYNSITAELKDLQDKLSCPDDFIYDFLDAIKKEWDPKSCKMKAKSSRKYI